jgi:hypothetical protein
MRALGLAVDLPNPNRPALRAVLLEDSLGAGNAPSLADINVVDEFDIPTVDDSRATQLMDLAEAISGRIRTLKPDIIVVRRADQPPRASNTEGPRIRLLATGAVTAAARLLVVRTTLRTGKECGSAYGGKKDEVDTDARSLVTSASRVPAAAAALAGLTADRA